MTPFVDLEPRAVRRARLSRLAVVCLVAAVTVGLVACGPGDAALEQAAVSGRMPTSSVEPLRAGRPSPWTTWPTTTTTSVPPTTRAAKSHSHPQVVRVGAPQAIVAAFGRFGDRVVREATVIARCESNLNPRAVNASSGASGLFQVMPFWRDEFERVTGRSWGTGRFDAFASASFAAWLWSQSHSWSHWACRKALA